MSEMPNNPFLEGSEKIPDEEAQAAAKALAEEAAAVRAKSHEIKEKAAKARVAKRWAPKKTAKLWHKNLYTGLVS